MKVFIFRFCYDGDKVIAEYDGSNTLLRKFIYGPGIDEPIFILNLYGWFFYHLDGLGNVAALTNEASEIVERYEYDVFGKCTVHTSPGVDGEWMTDDDITGTESAVGNPYMFTGRRLDTETGLYYYRFRYYKPEIGRFLQPDPIRYADGLNIYTYCGNDPIKSVDPLGLCGKDAIVGLPPEGFPSDEKWKWESTPDPIGGGRWRDPNGGTWRPHPDKIDPGHGGDHYDYNPPSRRGKKFRTKIPVERPIKRFPSFRFGPPIMIFPWILVPENLKPPELRNGYRDPRGELV